MGGVLEKEIVTMSLVVLSLLLIVKLLVNTLIT